MLFITATQNYSVFRHALQILKHYDNLLVLLCVRELMLCANQSFNRLNVANGGIFYIYFNKSKLSVVFHNFFFLFQRFIILPIALLLFLTSLPLLQNFWYPPIQPVLGKSYLPFSQGGRGRGSYECKYNASFKTFKGKSLKRNENIQWEVF